MSIENNEQNELLRSVYLCIEEANFVLAFILAAGASV